MSRSENAEQTPQYPLQLGGEIWGMVTYFNPKGYRNKLENLRLFSAGVRRQGLKLLVIELALGGAPFVVEEQIAERVIQVRSNTVLWQKERLLNIGLGKLPDRCDKVAWLDGDVLFGNGAWVSETSRLLSTYVVVQPYDVAWSLPPGLRMAPSEFRADTFQMVRHGIAYLQAQARGQDSLSGHSGFAWAARRDLLSTHGFFDRFILGGGDLIMTWAMYDERFLWASGIRKWFSDIGTSAQAADAYAWKERFHSGVNGSVSCVNGPVFHLWHGASEKRQYFSRHLMLREAAFDPRTDIAYDECDCWKWNSDKPDLHKRVRDYFWNRQEDESTLG